MSAINEMQHGRLGIVEDYLTDNQTFEGNAMIAQHKLNFRDVIRIIVFGR